MNATPDGTTTTPTTSLNGTAVPDGSDASWGVFVSPLVSAGHIAPSLGGQVAHGHILDPWCWCQPVNTSQDKSWVYVPMWSHRDAHWPGSSDPAN